MFQLQDFDDNNVSIIINNISSNEECYNWAGNKFDYPISIEDIEKYIQEIRNDKESRTFSYININNQEVIGHIKVGEIDSNKKMCTIQYVLIDKKYRGLGLGKKMLEETCDQIFKTFSINIIRLRVMKNNIIAKKIYTSIGFIELKDNFINRNKSIRMMLTYNRFLKYQYRYLYTINNNQIINKFWKYKYNYVPQVIPDQSFSKSINLLIKNEEKLLMQILKLIGKIELICNKAYNENIIYIFTINNFDYINILTTKNEIEVQNELIYLVLNNIYAPENLKKFANIYLNVVFEEKKVKLDLLSSQNMDYLDEFNNIYIPEIISPYKKIKKSSLLLFEERCKNLKDLEIDTINYDCSNIKIHVFKIISFLNKYNILDKKIMFSINNKYNKLLCLIALILLNVNMSNENFDIIIVDNKRENYKCSILISFEDILNEKEVLELDKEWSYLEEIIKERSNYKNKNIFYNKIYSIFKDFITKNEISLEISFEEESKNQDKKRISIDKIVTKSVEKILRKKNIKKEDNFFQEGGDSILAMMLVLDLEQYDIKIELNDIYRNPVIGELCSFINSF